MPEIETAVAYCQRTPAGGWRVAGTRISLDSVLAGWRAGEPPEAIAAYPGLTAERVHGAIAFYLHNRAELDRHFEEAERRWEALKRRCDVENREFREKLLARRREMEAEGRLA
jgi:uncharacterized protein (DUF433 family)